MWVGSKTVTEIKLVLLCKSIFSVNKMFLFQIIEKAFEIYICNFESKLDHWTYLIYVICNNQRVFM